MNRIKEIFGSLMLGGYAAVVFHNHQIDGAALPLFSVGLTVLVILLGEILPKSMGSRFAMPVALLITCSAVGSLLKWMSIAVISVIPDKVGL